VTRLCEAISEVTGRDQTLLDQTKMVGKLNRTMIGWANYFCLGPVSQAYRVVDQHAHKRLRQWLCAKQAQSGVAGGQAASAVLSARSARPRPPYQADE